MTSTTTDLRTDDSNGDMSVELKAVMAVVSVLLLVAIIVSLVVVVSRYRKRLEIKAGDARCICKLSLIHISEPTRPY